MAYWTTISYIASISLILGILCKGLDLGTRWRWSVLYSWLLYSWRQDPPFCSLWKESSLKMYYYNTMGPFHSSGDHYLVITERQVQSQSNTCGFVISNSSEVCFFNFFHFHYLSTEFAWVLFLSWYLAGRGCEEINFRSPCQGAYTHSILVSAGPKLFWTW